MDVITVKNKEELEAMEKVDGKLVYNGEDQKYYMAKANEWISVPVTMSSEGLVVNLYELNKQIVEQLDFITEEEFQGKRSMLEEFMTGNAYMLYGREIGYFTVFMRDKDKKDYNNPVDAFYDIFSIFEKQVYSMEYNDDKTAIEIWIKFNEQATVLYLFDYSAAVVYYE
jgi:hypothetical protein